MLAGVTYPPIMVFLVMLLVTATLPTCWPGCSPRRSPWSGWPAATCCSGAGCADPGNDVGSGSSSRSPSSARVLSNGANAGLSITTAWVVAEGEMAEPAKTEIQRLNAAVRFGTPLEDAMLQMNDRLPAREVRVLMSTLVVSARSGGSLIKALRDISLTLDDRKEVRREVRTVLAQSRATGALVTLMGAGILLALNAIQPGTVERMTQTLLGQIALVVSIGLFLIGHLMVQRMTRIER